MRKVLLVLLILVFLVSGIAQGFWVSKNPFSPPQEKTFIVYELSYETTVNITIYNMAGEIVRKLIQNELQDVGEYRVLWDGRNDFGNLVASGIYLCLVSYDGKKEVKPIGVLR